MSKTIGELFKVATISSFGTLTTPDTIRVTINGAVVISEAGKVLIYDPDPETGAFASRPELSGTGNFGAAVSIYGRNDEIVVIGTPNDASSLGKISYYEYNFVTSSWSTALTASGTIASGALGTDIKAVQDSFILVSAPGESRIRQFRKYTNSTPADVIEEYPTATADTTALVGTVFDVSNGGLVVVGNPTASSNAGTIGLYTLTSKVWTLYGAVQTGAASAQLGSLVAISRNGNRVIAKTSTDTINVYKTETVIPATNGLIVETTPSISVAGGAFSDLDISGDGRSISLIQATAYSVYEYLDRSETWSQKVSESGLVATYDVAYSQMSNVCGFVYADGVGRKADIHYRRMTTGFDKTITEANSLFPIKLDGQEISTLTNEDFLTRDGSITTVRGLSVVESKIIDAIRAIQVSDASVPIPVPTTLKDMADVDLIESKERNNGRILAYSNSRGKWIDDGNWWEDLRFPLTPIYQNGNFGDRIEVGYTYIDPVNSAVVFRANSWLSADPFEYGEGLISLAQLPHSWVEGTELRPHIHWLQERAINPNLVLIVRVIKNGETDTYNTTGLLPINPDNDGVAGDYIYYRGENVFTYPGTGSITQITSFKRFNKVSNTFTSNGIDGTGLIGSSMLACIICRDTLNTSGMFPFTNPGDNPTTQDETSTNNLNDVPIYEFDIHYMTNSAGSVDEIPESMRKFRII